MKKEILYGIKWNTISAILSNIINIAVPFYLALYIAPTEFGKLAIVTILYGFLNMLFRPAFGEARIQKDDLFKSKEIDDVVFTINLCKMIAVTMILYFSINVLNQYYDDDFTVYVYILILVNIVSSFRSPRIYILAKDLNFKKSNLLEVIPALFGGFFAVAYAVYSKEIISILYGMLISSLLRTLISQYYVSYLYKVSFNFSRLQGIFSFGIWVTVERIITNIGNNIDKILLSVFLDLHWLGIYQIAKSIGFRLFTIISQVLRNVLFPVLSKMKNNSNLDRQYIKKVVSLSFLAGCIILLFLYIIIPYAIEFLGSKWENSVNPGMFLALGGLFAYMSNIIFTGIIKALGNAKITATSQLFKIGLLISLTVVLGYYFKLYGVIAAVLVTEAVIFAFSLMQLNKNIKGVLND